MQKNKQQWILRWIYEADRELDNAQKILDAGIPPKEEKSQQQKVSNNYSVSSLRRFYRALQIAELIAFKLFVIMLCTEEVVWAKLLNVTYYRCNQKLRVGSGQGSLAP
ncbi:hypothetical protein PsorP6_000234 [Peronosclerospora sorghi]|uniref:Uncharacterized protein n=1 Tax=Peronosclerospora sorghi TaxID=230839 RepID=A0ACC0WPY2_9STRA|nr:hypothetical protein PsorP6_000234 [Peronosclerospora sorghi]